MEHSSIKIEIFFVLILLSIKCFSESVGENEIGFEFEVNSTAIQIDTLKLFSLSGIITDSTKAPLIGVSVSIDDLALGTVTNSNGFYSLIVKSGNYEIIFSGLGYQKLVQSIDVNSDAILDVNLLDATTILDEVVVSATNSATNVTSNTTGAHTVKATELADLPSFMGEVNIM